MDKNPHIPYETYQAGEYVSLPSNVSRAVPLIRARDYSALEKRFRDMPADVQRTLLDIVSKPVVQTSGAAISARVLDEVKKQSIGVTDKHSLRMDADTITILRDIGRGKPGFTAPVYNVNGQPVVAQKFDAQGRLDANVARIYGVPADPAEAIAQKVQGIRRTLLSGPAHPSPQQQHRGLG